jgi:uncharacterized iron-regulated membrane protein
MPLAGIRGAIRSFHFALGLTLAIPVFVLGISGSLLVVLDHPAASSAEGPHHHARGADDQRRAHRHEPRTPISSIIAAAQAAVPHGYRPTQYRAGGAGGPARVVFAPEGRGDGNRAASTGRPRQVLIDPRTLAIVPATRRDPVIAFIHGLHENMLAGSTGRIVVGWFGVGMLLLGLTGPIAWWPGRKRLRDGFVVKTGAGRFRLVRDLHRAVGIVTLVFFLAVTISGTFIIFPLPIERAIALVMPAPATLGDHRIPRAPRGTPPMDVDAAVALARQHADGNPLSIVFADRAGQPMQITVAPSRTVVTIDPYEQRVVSVRDPSLDAPGDTLIAGLRPLHEGDIYGWPWRTALFLTGILPPFFAVTGIALFVIKRRSRAAALS